MLGDSIWTLHLAATVYHSGVFHQILKVLPASSYSTHKDTICKVDANNISTWKLRHMKSIDVL